MITISNVEQKFKSIKKCSEYVRVSDSHPLELYLGLNEKGCFTLRYNGAFSPIKILGNDLLEIKQYKFSEYNSILFSFNSNDNYGLFFNFCVDIINKTSSYEGENGYSEIVNRYNQWKKMFYGSSSVLSEPEILGLIGELMFLKDKAIPSYGETDGLKGWSGPEPTHKDFSYGNDWFEIKSINGFKNTVHISSLEQLDSEFNGKLIVYSFEKMSPSFNGSNLNKLVELILNSFEFEENKDVFVSKLKQVGYSYNEIYDNFIYNFIKCDEYRVNSEFPRIKKENLPVGVSKVQYEIVLTEIEKFKE